MGVLLCVEWLSKMPRPWTREPRPRSRFGFVCRIVHPDLVIADHLVVVLGLQNAPGVLIDLVLDEADAAAGDGGIHLIARGVGEAAHAVAGADAVMPELVAILHFVAVGLAVRTIEPV